MSLANTIKKAIEKKESTTSESNTQYQKNILHDKGSHVSENLNTVKTQFQQELGRQPTQSELEQYFNGIYAGTYNSPQDIANALRSSYPNPAEEGVEEGKYKFDFSKLFGMASAAAPDEATFYQTSEGTYRKVRMADGSVGYVFEQDPAMKAKQDKEMAMFDEVLSSLGVSSPERVKQIEDTANTFTKDVLSRTQNPTEQGLIGRGLRGSSIYKDTLTDLMTKVGVQGTLYKDQLYNQDEAQKLAVLGALQGGIGSDSATSLSASGQGSSALANSESQRNNALQNYLSLLTGQNQVGQQFDAQNNQWLLSYLQGIKNQNDNLNLQYWLGNQKQDTQSNIWPALIQGGATIAGALI
jgi:hypothetical protein